MANEEHLRILKQGVEAWNKWRVANRDVRPELNDVDLSDIDLSDADLSDADLSLTNLRRVDLTGANLRRADFGGVDLSGAHLSGADLHNTRVAWTYFTDLDLSNVQGLDTIDHAGPSDISIRAYPKT